MGIEFLHGLLEVTFDQDTLHYAPQYEPAGPSPEPESEPYDYEQEVTEELAWRSYEELLALDDITWEDVEELRHQARVGPEELRDIYRDYKEAFRALGYEYDAIIEQAKKDIEKFGYPIELSQERLEQLKSQYARLRAEMMRDIARAQRN